MADITNIVWHPDRTEPTDIESRMQVDFSDNTQIMVSKNTDVSDMDALIKSLHPILFP